MKRAMRNNLAQKSMFFDDKFHQAIKKQIVNR